MRRSGPAVRRSGQRRTDQPADPGRRGRRASIKSPGLRAYDPARIGAFRGNQGRYQRVRPHRPQHHARGPREEGGLRFRRGQRPDRRQDAGAPAQVRLDPRQPGPGDRGQGRRHRGRQGLLQGRLATRPGADPVEGPRRRRRVRGHRPLHQEGRRRQAPRRGRQARDHHRAGDRPRRQLRDGRQPRDLRSGQARRDLERVVHDQLSRAVRQGAARDASASPRAG